MGRKPESLYNALIAENSLSQSSLIREKNNTDKSVFHKLIFGLKASNFPGVKEGDGAMMEIGMKIGDRYKDKSTGKIYVIRMETASGTLCLEGENGLGRRLTGKGSLRQTCEKLGDITS